MQHEGFWQLKKQIFKHTALALCLLSLSYDAALAITDEIQVYTGDIVAPGDFGLTLHTNYTPDGIKSPEFPGALVDDHAFSSVAEWAYGVTDWFEAGLYLPLYAHTPGQGWTYNGFKLRALFVQPGNADKGFYYGVNFEFSWNEKVWDRQANTGEIRPIIGWRLPHGFSITFNPILDNNYKGFNRLEFVPASRLDYAVNEHWTIAAEEYDDFGSLHQFLSAREQSHQLWGVVDYTGDPISIEAGIGFGLTPATDNLALKLMFTTDLTGPHRLFQ